MPTATGDRAGWSSLLPYVDQGAVYGLLDDRLMSDANGTNARVRSRPDPRVCLPLRLTVPDSAPELQHDRRLGRHGEPRRPLDSRHIRCQPGGGAALEVAAIHVGRPQAVRGAMGFGGVARIAEFTDGTSNSAMVWEIRVGVTETDPRGTWALGR